MEEKSIKVKITKLDDNSLEEWTVNSSAFLIEGNYVVMLSSNTTSRMKDGYLRITVIL